MCKLAVCILFVMLGSVGCTSNQFCPDCEKAAAQQAAAQAGSLTLSYASPENFGDDNPIPAQDPTLGGRLSAQTTAYAVIAGSLPPGLALDAGSGAITGNPTAPGSYTFTVQASNGALTATSTPTYNVFLLGLSYATPEQFITGTAIAPQIPTVTYQTLQLPTTFAVTFGGLPPGLVLDSGTGQISGSPTTPGVYPFSVTATEDGVTATASATYTVVAMGLSYATPLTFYVGVAINPPQSPTLVNAPTATTAYSSADLPAWLSLNGTTGTITGTPTTAGTFNVTITALNGGVTTSFSFNYSVLGPPTITLQPVSQSVCVNGTATLSVTATNAISYQWYQGGVPISGANASTFTVTATGTVGTFTYTCTVTNPAGSVPSNPATLTVGLAIITQPENLAIQSDQAATFFVSAAGNGLTYQWYQTTLLPAATTPVGDNASVYTTTYLTHENSGNTYYVVVTDACGSTVTSNTVTLTVDDAMSTPPTILVQPQGQASPISGTPSFSVVYSSPIPTNLAWFNSNNPLASVGNSVPLTLQPVTSSDDGTSYYAEVTNTDGSGQAVSVPAPLAVGQGILAVGQPTSQFVGPGASATFTFNAISSNPSSLTYQWSSAGPGSPTFTPIPGANAANYVLATTSSADSGTVFQCEVSNGVTTPLISQTAALFVGALGTIDSLDSNWVSNGSTLPFTGPPSGFALTQGTAGNQIGSLLWPNVIPTARLTVAFTLTIPTSGTPSGGFCMVLADPSQGATPGSQGLIGGLGAQGIPGFVLAFDPTGGPTLEAGPGAAASFGNPWTLTNTNLPALPGFSNSNAYVVTLAGGMLSVSMNRLQVFTGEVAVPPAAYLGFTAATTSGFAYQLTNLTATLATP
jgi:hypothetical protein